MDVKEKLIETLVSRVQDFCKVFLAPPDKSDTSAVLYRYHLKIRMLHIKNLLHKIDNIGNKPIIVDPP